MVLGDHRLARGAPLSKAILHTETTPGVVPFYRPIDTGDHTGATFQTTSKFHGHLSFFVQRVKIGRAGINTEPFFAGMADILIKCDMGLFVVFKGI